MTAVVATPPRKAHNVTSQGSVTDTAPPELEAVCTPAPKKTMAAAAPKEAPWDTPKVEAEASGLRSTLCMTQPDMARANPTPVPTAMRGMRTFQRMVRLC